MSWLSPLASLYSGGIQFKNYLFDRHLIAVHRVSIPVVSIGNLTMGGTGKTPFADLCIKKLSHKHRLGVVSRAYKASAKAPTKVDINTPKAAAIFGDEPTWLAKQNPRAQFFVGETKWAIAQWATQQSALDVIIVDDGFQHRALHRDLDIVILDATEKWENYQLIPAGRAREGFEALARADVVVISKTNWASPESTRKLKEKIPSGKTIVELCANLTGCYKFLSSDSSTQPIREFKGQDILAFASIASPQVFKNQLEELLSQKVDFVHFPDHHQFSEQDIQNLISTLGTKKIMCTEKDAIKMQGLWPAQKELWVAKMEIQISHGEEGLDAHFHRLFS